MRKRLAHSHFAPSPFFIDAEKEHYITGKSCQINQEEMALSGRMIDIVQFIAFYVCTDCNLNG